MQRKVSKLVYLSAGAALAWFLDPVSGSDRRRKVSDQVSGLTGGQGAVTDPTGGAAPYLTPTPPPAPVIPPDPDSGLLYTPDDGADDSRADLRTNW